MGKKVLKNSECGLGCGGSTSLNACLSVFDT